MHDSVYNFALLGHPVKHSVSPSLHAQFLAEHGMIGGYVLIDAHAANLQQVISHLIGLGFRGANVTIPHKESVLPIAHKHSDAVLRIGAANTLVFCEDGQIHAHNTDYMGFLDSLDEDKRHGCRNALIIGAGGSARAVVYAMCYHMGVSRIDFVLRDAQSTESIARHDALVSSMQMPSIQFGYLDHAHPDYDIVVNTSPVGMSHHSEDQSPLSQDVLAAIHRCNPACLVYDLIYNPDQTQLLRSAQMVGLSTRNGYQMLVQQARRAFGLWVGD